MNKNNTCTRVSSCACGIKSQRKENMERKLLVLDIDGTLTDNNKQIPEKNRLAIEKMMQKGHSCMLASGRPTPGMTFIADALNFKEHGGYLLSYNGGKVINYTSGEVVFEQVLDSKYLVDLRDFARENNCGILTYSADAVLSGTGLSDYTRFESNLLRLPTVEVDFKDIDFPVNKCLMTADPHIAEACQKVLAKKYDGILSIYRSEPFFIEIVPLGVDKANSISKILPVLGFEREDCICVGDGYNDVSMIKYAGIGVAMANAVAEVKEVATYHTVSNEECGVAKVIEELVLGE